jgi:hypothetical protein
MSSLSSGRQGAVRAVEPAAASKAEPAAAPASSKAESPPPAAPKAEPAPAAAAAPARPATETAAPPAPKATASPAAKKPSDAQVAAIRSACRSDYQKVCADVPTGGEAALQCLDMNKAKVSGGCQQALNPVGGGAGAPAPAKGSAPVPATAATGAPAAAPAAAAPPALVLRPMRPAEELFVVRSACSGDVRALCAGVPPGGGRIMQCLATQAASVSPACKAVLGQFAAQ